MTARNYPAVTQVPASMFEMVKMASKEEIHSWCRVGLPYLSIFNSRKRRSAKSTFRFFKIFTPPVSLKQLRTLFVLEQRKGLSDKDLKILDSLHVLCRVKALTSFPEYEIILPGEVN